MTYMWSLHVGLGLSWCSLDWSKWNSITNQGKALGFQLLCHGVHNWGKYGVQGKIR